MTTVLHGHSVPADNHIMSNMLCIQNVASAALDISAFKNSMIFGNNVHSVFIIWLK